jgi:DNA-binding NarL/FixJ family response regulator
MTAYIIDDHPLMRRAISNVFRKLPYKFDIVEIESMEKLLICVDKYGAPKIITIEIGALGIQNISVLKYLYPASIIVVISEQSAKTHGGVALQCGATLFIEKSVETKVIESRFLSIASSIYSRNLLRINFTNRQVQLLRLINKGLSNDQIGVYLNIKSTTVKVHLSRLYKSIGVINRTQAVLYAKNLDMYFDA